MPFKPSLITIILIFNLLMGVKPLKASICFDDSTSSNMPKSLALSLSSRGLGLETGFKFRTFNRIGLRANVSFLTFDKSQNIKMDKGTSVDIFPNIKTLALAGLIDYYPFKRKIFRLTGGLSFEAIQNYQISFSSASGLNLGGLQIASDDFGNINFGIKWNALRPYIGLGFGRISMKKQLGFGFDMGIAYMGSPKLSLKYEGFLETTTIDEEIKKIESNMSGYSYYPYISFQFKYKLYPVRNQK